MITVIQLLGGKGTRLEGITRGKIAKPLVPLNNMSIVERQINHLIKFGCKNFIWVCFHMKEDFEIEKIKLIEKYKSQIESITIFSEKLPLSTFGSLYGVVNTCKEKEFLVLYGDIIVNFDLYRFVCDFRKFEDSDTHIFTRYSNHPEDSDKIQIDNNSYVSRFISKEEISQDSDPPTTTSGIYLARKIFFEKLIHWSGQKCDLYSEVLPIDGHLIKASAYQSSEFILDVGTLKRYRDAEIILKNNSFYSTSYLFQRPALLLDRDGVVIKENGYIDNIQKIIFNEDLIKIMSILKKRNILVGIITNQPLIAQGRLNYSNHVKIKNFIINYLAKSSAIDFYYECLHYPKTGYQDEVPFYKKSCYCRKPKTGLIQKSIHHHNIDLTKSIFIGDNETDIIAGRSSLIKSFFYNFSSGDLFQLNKEHKKNTIKNVNNILDLFKK